MISKADRIKELTGILNRASKAYYMQDTELMSNYEYDALYDELVQLEKETGITLSNSPTIHVGYEVLSELPKEEHELSDVVPGQDEGCTGSCGLAGGSDRSSVMEDGWTDNRSDI